MKRKGLLRTFVRLALMLLAAVVIDTAVVLFPVRAYASIPNNCEVACKDVNDCGCIPFYSNGVLVDCLLACNERYWEQTEACCGIGKLGVTRRHFYDCNGDNRIDCECKYKNWIYSDLCWE